MRPVSVVSDRNEGKGGTPNCGQARYQPGAGRADLQAYLTHPGVDADGIMRKMGI